jgi:hypothetical protein
MAINLKLLSFLCGLGTATVSEMKGTNVDTPKDTLANMLARVVKHDMCSFADSGKSRRHSSRRERKFAMT